jgi:hypothetical protein
MTLFLSLPRRLMSAFGLALVCAFPVAYSLAASAAELEGTVVTVDGSVPVQVQVEAPHPVAAPASPDAVAPEQPPQPTSAEDHERWKQDNERWKQDNERWVRDNQNWERDWEKNLSQAFGGNHQNGNGNDDGPSAMEALIVMFAVIALIIVLCSPLILLGVYLVLRHKAKARHQQALNTNIDKLLAAGRDIPVELLRGDEPKSDEHVGSRDKGIRNIFLGTGWLVFLTIMVGFDIGSAGFIWIALGASQVVIWYLNRPNVSEQAGQQD